MDKDDSIKTMRHSAAHVLAAASVQLRPETRLGVGPDIENGFYHDIDVDENYSEQDLKVLEKKMKEIQRMKLSIVKKDISKNEAKKLFKNDPFKLELIEDIEGDTVSISDMGDGFFVTLCDGAHVKSTGDIGYFKLTHLAGVYWKGDESNKQIQRIYGVAFPSKDELKAHMTMLEEAKKRDHRKIGKDLDLFTFSPLVGAGLPLFTPRGTVIRDELEKFLRSIQEPLGFQRVNIPHITKPELYKTSGHWDKFKDELFHVSGKHGAKFVMKPMNCPHHTQIYASKQRSYRDLPLRFVEVTTVYRDELAGELQGLSRVRSITQDDGHVFCREDQMEQEIETIMSIIDAFYTVFEFEMQIRLSLRDPEKADAYLGTDEIWEKSEDMLRSTLRAHKKDFEEQIGEAAFYGPKIDFVGKDSLGREWQLATIQLDFNMPERFGLTYIDSDNTEKTPIMIHRAIAGALERFIAVLLEHYAGNLPLWLSPVQVIVLPISDDQVEYAEEVAKQLRSADIRVDVDERSEGIGRKIRDAEMLKVPIMLVVGQKEARDSTVSVRSHADGDEGVQEVPRLVENLVERIAERK